MQKETKNAFAIGSSCVLAYAACYLGRNILSSTLPLVMESGAFSRESLGRMGSVFFIAYGIGQLINGFAGNRIGAKYMVSVGLTVAGICCAVFPMISSEAASLVLWGACGFLSSMLWGPLTRTIGENTGKRIATILLTMLTTASIAGSAAAYLLASVSALRGDWHFAFIASGAVMAALGVLWYLASTLMLRAGMIKNTAVLAEAEEHSMVSGLLHGTAFVPMTIAAMLNGIIRNAVAFWIPTYIAERFAISPADASAVSSILPFVNLAGAFLSVPLVKRMHGDEKKGLVLFFSFSAMMFLAMCLPGGDAMFLRVGALFCASSAMTGACNLIFTHYVIRFSGTGKISGIAGFLDFSSYLSASAANSLFSALLPGMGWNFVVFIWAGVSLAGAAVSVYASKKIARVRRGENAVSR